MKIKLLLMLFFIACFQTRTMNTNPHTTLKIEKCSGAGCNQETTQKCNACLLSYYCSRECQIKDWGNHKKVCKAYQSDIEHIRHAFRTFFNMALQTGKHSHIAQAISLHMQALIRIDQDRACAHDESITSMNVMFEGRQLLNDLIAKRICSLKDAQKMLRQEVPAAIALVKQRTLDDKLVAPYEVRDYGVVPPKSKNVDPDEFISANEWKEARLAIIADYEAKFKPEHL